MAATGIVQNPFAQAAALQQVLDPGHQLMLPPDAGPVVNTTGFGDPPQDILAHVATVGQALALSGMAPMQGDDPHFPGAVVNSLLAHLGMIFDTNIETWGSNSKAELYDEISMVQVAGTDDQGNETYRPMTFSEKGMAKLADRYIRMRLGLEHGSAQAPQPQGTDILTMQAQQMQQMQMAMQQALQTATHAATMAATAMTAMGASSSGTQPVPTQSQVGAERAVSVQLIANQVLESTCRKLTKEEIIVAYSRWEKHYGRNKRPPVDADPTEDQLAVVRHLMESNEIPYVDFAIFGPHGGRMMRKQKTAGMVIDAGGSLKPIEFIGPPNFDTWLASFDVLANSFILLGAVDVGTLDEYRSYQRRFHARFGDSCYALQYQSDVRMRSEQMGRLRRQAEASFQKAFESANGGPFVHDYDPGRPWNHIFNLAIEDKKFWHDELEYNALLMVSTKVSASSFLGGDARVSQVQPPAAPPGVAPIGAGAWPVQETGGGKGGWGAPPPQKKLKVHNVGADGLYATSRSNKPICPGFTAGTCTGATQSNHFCPVNPNFVHQCNKCLDWRHGGSGCSLTTATAMPNAVAHQNKGGKGGKQGKGKGGKKGKGKGGKWQY